MSEHFTFKAEDLDALPRWYSHDCPHGPHRGPESPDEDIAACQACGGMPYAVRRAGYPGGPTDAWHPKRRQPQFTRCSSGRRVLRWNPGPGLARENFPTPGPYPGPPMHGEVAFFQDPQDAIDYVETVERIEKVRALHHAEWSGTVPPGGMICAACGEPVESEPCSTIRALDGENT